MITWPHRSLLFGTCAYLVALGTHAADDVCSPLMSQGVYEMRNTASASAVRENLSSVFCRQESATLQSAKQNGTSAGVNLGGLLKASGDHTESESNYQEFRSKLCHSSDYSYEGRFFLQEQVQQAAKAILDTINACLARKGLKQYLTKEDPRSDRFVWNIVFDPPGDNGTAKVSLATDPRRICKLAGRDAPDVIEVGAAGKHLLCVAPAGKPAVLVLNSSSANPSPPAIYVNTPPTPKETSWIDLGKFPAPVDMKAPISIALPRGMECKQVSKEGAWHPHCPNKNWVMLCPNLKVSEGQAISEFDGPTDYGDNCDVANVPHCSYNIACREITSRRIPK